jgi:phosphatidylserine/phosphatidylglycerophosphate/cardiolipin synthase-like enzyme
VGMAWRFSVGPEEAAAAFVLHQPAERVVELVALLRDGRLAPDTGRARVAQTMVLGADSLEPTLQLLDAWRGGEESGSRLAEALAALLLVRRTTADEGIRAELVWTGHKPPGSSLRNTPQVVQEMLDRAERHIVVLAYTLWFGQADAGAVLDQLARARGRGARLTFVVDRAYVGAGVPHHNLIQLRDRWPKGVPRPEVYSWGDEDDRIAKLHAKLVVVDRRDMLVTSANLTGHGMSGNLELGARLEGRPAERAHDHVMDLITSKVFARERLW